VIRLPVIGVDPGHRETGIVVCFGAELVEHAVIVRKGEGMPDQEYLDRVIAAMTEMRRRSLASGQPAPLVGLEGVQAPNPHAGMTNPTGIIGTAVVFGWVWRAFPDAIIVRPQSAGKGPIGAYPDELHPTRGDGRGRDKLRHCRSAYDIALATLNTVRVGAA
jgi:hypothetical protein